MEIRINYFGPAREAAGTSQEVLTIEEGIDVAGLLRKLKTIRPELAHLLPACRVALGDRYASASEVLSGGDEVALIPPVAGG